jgi:hypothetical protein
MNYTHQGILRKKLSRSEKFTHMLSPSLGGLRGSDEKASNIDRGEYNQIIYWNGKSGFLLEGS